MCVWKCGSLICDRLDYRPPSDLELKDGSEFII